MTEIRYATNEDVPILMEMIQEAHKESPRYSRLSFNFHKVLELFYSLIVNDPGFAIVAERDGQIIGFMIGFCAPYWGSDDLVASDILVYITPKYRGGSSAKKMVEAFIAWAKEKGAILIQLGVSTGIHTERTVSLYESLGLKRYSIGLEV